MPIIHMAHKREEIPEGAINVRDISDDYRSHLGKCSWQSDEEFEQQRAAYTLFTYHTHVGLCLYDYERNGYDDSDFYMVVWDEEKNQPLHIEFASTRGWSYPCYGSSPDATPEIQAKFDAWKLEQQRQEALWLAEVERRTVRKGKTIEVVRGRKVAKGTVGECIWTGVGSYGPRVGLRTESGDVFWTALANVEVKDVQEAQQ